MADVEIVKANGERELFDAEKLRTSLRRAHASSEDQEAIVEHIVQELEDGMTTTEIYGHAHNLLKQRNASAAGNYSLRSAILQLGPSGYPFEDFIAELFKNEGYQAHTDEMVPGKCVEHEMDVIACNPQKKLVMVEAKFHNKRGINSDVQDVLYTKARFDDIQSGEYEYYGCSMLHERWFVTNTKFSSTAVEYGECVGLTMLGWNYPENDHLQDWVQQSGLHPLTSLSTLSGAQKRNILKQGVVLNKTIKKHPEYLEGLGLDKDAVHAVLEEITTISG